MLRARRGVHVYQALQVFLVGCGQAPWRGSELEKPAGCVQVEWTTRGGLTAGGKAVLWLLVPGPTQALSQALYLRWKVLGGIEGGIL